MKNKFYGLTAAQQNKLSEPLNILLCGLPIAPFAAQSARTGSNASGHARVFQKASVTNWKLNTKLMVADFLGHDWKKICKQPLLFEIELVYPFKKDATKQEIAKVENGLTFYKLTKTDLDNNVKPLQDALTGVVWDDDATIGELRGIKRYGHNPAIYFSVSVLPLMHQRERLSDKFRQCYGELKF